MKKTLLLMTVICFGLISCNNRSQQQSSMGAQNQEIEKAKQDSINKAQEAEKQKQLAYEDSVAIYAWGDVRFGMTKSEVLQTKAFDGAIKNIDFYGMNYEKQKDLKEALELKSIPFIKVKFGGDSGNEVICVCINSYAEWDNFSELRDDMITLINVFKKKYNEPSYINEFLTTLDYLDLDKINRGSSIKIVEWTIGSGNGKNGTKYIKMNASKQGSTTYEYECVITNSDFPKQSNGQSQKEVEEENKRVKETVDNAF